jgi:carboxylesterase
MTEFLILSAGLVLLVSVLCRKGVERVQAPWVFWLFMGYGLVIGVLAEGMPFAEVSGRPTIRTFLAAMIGVFSMRLLARGVRGWARGYRDEETGASSERARLVHPLIGIGIVISGMLMLHEACVARHMALEIRNTPRSPSTGIVKGAEPVSLTQEDASASAVLLLHGFYGSPAELGELPAKLHEAGYAVEAPLLPGHGTTPADLRDTGPDAWIEAALAAYDALVEKHSDVTLIGFSMGGFVATNVANQRDVPRVVLINPFTGAIFQPWYSPIPSDDLAEFMEPLVDAIVRPKAMVRLHDMTQYPRIRSYRTIPLSPVVRLHNAVEVAKQDDDFRWVPCPTLVLLSTDDEVTPSAPAHEIYDAPDIGPVEVRDFPNGDHIMLLDYDREDAVAAILEWLQTP